MIDLEAAFAKHVFQISIAERISHVPGHHLHAQPCLELSTFEIVIGLALQLFGDSIENQETILQHFGARFHHPNLKTALTVKLCDTPALVRDGCLDPFDGALSVFRSKRADRVRIVWWDGNGVCLYSKTLEDQGFCWRA